METTHEFLLLVLQQKLNTEKHPQHHINIDTIFWVWKPPDKTQYGKTRAAIRYEIYIMKIWNKYNLVVQHTQTWQNRTSTKINKEA